MTNLQDLLTSKIKTALAPLSPSILKKHGPSGPALFYEACYADIQNARVQEDDSLPQGVWQRPLKKVDWKNVEKLCLQALSEQSKDLQIAAWLLESWLHLYNLEGLQAGFELIRELCNTFWESIHPLPREEDMEFRLAPFEWIEEKILILLKVYPITMPNSDREKSYSLLEWASATQMAGMTNTAAQKTLKRIEKEGGVSLDQFYSSRDLTPSEYYQSLYQQGQHLTALIQRFNEDIKVKLPESSGFFYRLRDEIKQMIGFAEITLSARGLPPQVDTSLSAKIEHTVAAIQQKFFKKGSKNNMSPPSSKNLPLTLSSRDEAYAILEEVATYLSAVEPHSPTPLLIRRAITWGKMSLSEVLQELIQDKNDLVKINNLLGTNKNE